MRKTENRRWYREYRSESWFELMLQRTYKHMIKQMHKDLVTTQIKSCKRVTNRSKPPLRKKPTKTKKQSRKGCRPSTDSKNSWDSFTKLVPKLEENSLTLEVNQVRKHWCEGPPSHLKQIALTKLDMKRRTQTIWEWTKTSLPRSFGRSVRK